MGSIQFALQYADLVTHLVGDNNYSWVYFQVGEKQLFSKPIGYFERRLPGFIRSHRTVLVNPVYARTLHAPPHHKKPGQIQLLNGQRIPVSRRRWKGVVQELAHYRADRSLPLLIIDPSPVDVQSATDTDLTLESTHTSNASILLISDQPDSVEAVSELTAQQWATHSFWSTAQCHDLSDLLMALPQKALPALLLLDARTHTQARMRTLSRLKQNPALRRVPVILVVEPVDQLVVAGYERQANSVLCVVDDNERLISLLERVYRFWLGLAALPQKSNE